MILDNDDPDQAIGRFVSQLKVKYPIQEIITKHYTAFDFLAWVGGITSIVKLVVGFFASFIIYKSYLKYIARKLFNR